MLAGQIPHRWDAPGEALRADGVAPCAELCARDAAPAQIVERLGERDVVDERRELSVEERVASCAPRASRASRSARAHVGRPRARIARDGLDVPEGAQQRRRGLLAEAGDARDAVGRVADEREPVGHARGPDAARGAGAPSSSITRRACGRPAPRAARAALAEVLVGREDADLLDLVAPAGGARSRARRRPRSGPSTTRRSRARAPRPRGVELREQLGGHALVGLVAVVPVVANRADRVVERDRDVRDRLARRR